MSNPLPWEIHPALKDERLRIVANLIRRTRSDAIKDSYHPEKGDNAWNMACYSYPRICYAIQQASARGPYTHWLSVEKMVGLEFVFSIGMVPIRFFGGDPLKPPLRTLRVSPEERKAMQRAFIFANQPSTSGAVIRLSYRVDPKFEIREMTLLQTTRSGRVLTSWAIPLEGAAITPIGRGKEGVELRPLTALDLLPTEDKATEKKGG